MMREKELTHTRYWASHASVLTCCQKVSSPQVGEYYTAYLLMKHWSPWVLLDRRLEMCLVNKRCSGICNIKEKVTSIKSLGFRGVLTTTSAQLLQQTVPHSLV